MDTVSGIEFDRNLSTYSEERKSGNRSSGGPRERHPWCDRGVEGLGSEKGLVRSFHTSVCRGIIVLVLPFS